jgi:hypothetical protein
MKIGILTYHRAENYGALLQAYAMKTYLRSLGYDVSFVDYWPKYHSDYFSLFPMSFFKTRNIKGKIAMLFRFLLWGIPKYIRKCRLQGFMHEHFGLSKHPLYTGDDCKTEEYDVVVYGSDQIWRKQNLGGVGFDDWYFGADLVQSKRKVVYAGSMGAVCLDKDDEAYVLQQMKNFSTISVREKDLQDFLYSKGIETQLVYDPVFLLTKEDWLKVACSSHYKKNYILFYNLLNSPESVHFANNLSKETGLPVIEINKVLTLSRFVQTRYLSCASVEQFLGLIRDAEYVVSNSFHGVAFSLIFEKNFYAVGMGQRANRVVSLLESAGIPDRYISNETLSRCNETIPYDRVKEKVDAFRKISKNYLNESLQ